MINKCKHEDGHQFSILKVTKKWMLFLCEKCNIKESLYVPNPDDTYKTKNPN